MSKGLLILTVGTGTAGRTSNVAQGMANTIAKRKPRMYWLVPGNSEESRPVADLIREMVGDATEFCPWSGNDPYHAIARPDELENCRQTMREVIQKVRQSLHKDEPLWVNATSGTKQMSVGAVLAALDEGVGEIDFTVGERGDGVVITGTEKIETFDAGGFYAEKDRGLAEELIDSGVPSAAARVLRRHATLQADAEIAQCLYEWERQNYERARQIAAGCDALASVRGILTDLAVASRAATPSLLVVEDLLQTAHVFHARQDFESSISLIYKALESGLRLRLKEVAQLIPPYQLTQLRQIDLPYDMLAKFEATSRDKKTCILGLRNVVDILARCGDPAGEAYQENSRLKALVNVRNELTHQIRSVSKEESEDFLNRVRGLLGTCWKDWPILPPRPRIGNEVASAE